MQVITTNSTLPLDEAEFDDATWWHLAAHILYAYGQTDTKIPRLPGVPDIWPVSAVAIAAVPLLGVAGPVEAFALELYFKAGLRKDGQTPKRGHSLASQYRRLDTLLKRDIERRYAEWCKVNTGWGTWWGQHGVSVAFQDILDEASNAFDEFRYISQYSRDPTKAKNTFSFMAMPITEATRDALVSKYPEWAVHTALHGRLTTFRSR